MTTKKTAVIEFALDPSNAQKSRTKAMQLAATIEHVESITLKGNNKDRLVVMGREIDAVALTVLLKKKLGNATLVNFAPTKDAKKFRDWDRFRNFLHRSNSSYNYRTDHSDWRYDHQYQINYEPYPLNQIECFSYHDES